MCLNFLWWGYRDIGDRRHQINAEDLLGHPAGGEAHAMKNIGHNKLVCINVGQRLGNEITNYTNFGKRLFRNTGTSEMIDVSNISNVKNQ
jgi:uncharacterized cupin superfamily protein